MKKIAVLFAMLIGIGMMFSSTCKKDPYETISPIDTTGGGIINTKPTKAGFTVSVQDSSNQTSQGDIGGAYVCIFPRQGLMDSAIIAHGTEVQCLNPPYTLTTGTLGDYTAVVGPFPAATAPAQTTYYIWAENPVTGRTGTGSMSVSACKSCAATNNTVVILY